jgi:hypothetical protein
VKGFYKIKVMEDFNITITQEERSLNYRVVDKHSESCEFEVYQDVALMAVFEPDEKEFIHICRNPGGLDEEIIVQIAERIESYLKK